MLSLVNHIKIFSIPPVTNSHTFGAILSSNKLLCKGQFSLSSRVLARISGPLGEERWEVNTKMDLKEEKCKEVD
jgi:hypothetical protein